MPIVLFNSLLLAAFFWDFQNKNIKRLENVCRWKHAVGRGIYQKGAEEDEGDKVEIGKVTATLVSCSSRELIARPVTEAC